MSRKDLNPHLMVPWGSPTLWFGINVNVTFWYRSCVSCSLKSATPLWSCPWTTTAAWTWRASLLMSKPSMKKLLTGAGLRQRGCTRSRWAPCWLWLSLTLPDEKLILSEELQSFHSSFRSGDNPFHWRKETMKEQQHPHLPSVCSFLLLVSNPFLCIAMESLSHSFIIENIGCFMGKSRQSQYCNNSLFYWWIALSNV